MSIRRSRATLALLGIACAAGLSLTAPAGAVIGGSGAVCEGDHITALRPPIGIQVGLDPQGGLYLGSQRVAWRASLAQWDTASGRWAYAGSGPWISTVINPQGSSETPMELPSGRRIGGHTTFPIRYAGDYAVFYELFWWQGAVYQRDWVESHSGAGSTGGYCTFS